MFILRIRRPPILLLPFFPHAANTTSNRIRGNLFSHVLLVPHQERSLIHPRSEQELSSQLRAPYVLARTAIRCPLAAVMKWGRFSWLGDLPPFVASAVTQCRFAPGYHSAAGLRRRPSFPSSSSSLSLLLPN